MIYCNHCKLCSYVPLTIVIFLTALSAVLIASGNDIPQGTFRVRFERRIPHLCLNCRILFLSSMHSHEAYYYLFLGNSSIHNKAHYSVSAVAI